MFLGVLPDEERGRVAALVPALSSSSAGRKGGLGGRGLLERLVGWVEARVLSLGGNARCWGRICLPSSNGFYTADSVARAYGALANGGCVSCPGKGGAEEGGTRQLVNAGAIEELRRQLQLPRVDSPIGRTARMGVGFNCWPLAMAGGGAGVVGHAGIGGCIAFADLDAGLSVCVLKNTYSPSLVRGTTSPEVEALVQLVRSELGL